MTYTTNYNMKKPGGSDPALIGDINDNIDTVDSVMKANADNVTDAYDSSHTYYKGDLCIYNNVLYRCTTNTSATGTWDSTKWAQTTIEDEMKTRNASVLDYVDGEKIQFKIETHYLHILKGGTEYMIDIQGT